MKISIFFSTAFLPTEKKKKLYCCKASPFVALFTHFGKFNRCGFSAVSFCSTTKFQLKLSFEKKKKLVIWLRKHWFYFCWTITFKKIKKTFQKVFWEAFFFFKALLAVAVTPIGKSLCTLPSYALWKKKKLNWNILPLLVDLGIICHILKNTVTSIDSFFGYLTFC